jgi:hypothetical protein
LVLIVTSLIHAHAVRATQTADELKVHVICGATTKVLWIALIVEEVVVSLIAFPVGLGLTFGSLRFLAKLGVGQHAIAIGVDTIVVPVLTGLLISLVTSIGAGGLLSYASRQEGCSYGRVWAPYWTAVWRQRLLAVASALTTLLYWPQSSVRTARLSRSTLGFDPTG